MFGIYRDIAQRVTPYLCSLQMKNLGFPQRSDYVWQFSRVSGVEVELHQGAECDGVCRAFDAPAIRKALSKFSPGSYSVDVDFETGVWTVTYRSFTYRSVYETVALARLWIHIKEKRRRK
jgi:hypothetical protein